MWFIDSEAAKDNNPQYMCYKHMEKLTISFQLTIKFSGTFLVLFSDQIIIYNSFKIKL